MLAAILLRLAQPSTWAGLGLVLTHVPAAVAGEPQAIGAVVAGLVAVVVNERGAAR